jgi:uncharacterized RDD family membrane protein YckC
MTAEYFVERVLERMPLDTPNREQIAAELRATIAERMARGAGIEEVLQGLGDPEELAASYLAAVPLEPVPFWTRAIARLMDYGLCLVPVAVVCLLIAPRSLGLLRNIVYALAIACPLLMLYTIIAESSVDCTVGKRTFGMLVVRENGTRIGIGQAFVRQLPWLLQVFFIDAFFALFTEHHQRAFELLSKTRVVQAPLDGRIA